MKLLISILLGLLFSQLIGAQECPNAFEEFCNANGVCPSGSGFSLEEFTIPLASFNGICFGDFQSSGGDIQGRQVSSFSCIHCC